MRRVLVATASVHTTAAACDYLDGRLDSDDTVVVLTVEDDAVAGRDAGDAANVARTRLFEPTIETITREGVPATEIQAVAEQQEIDEILLGQVRGDPDVAGDAPGSTVRQLLSETDRPVVVLPV
ncbi:MAG: universal stress protein [Halovenus sp.]